ncbi:DUF952 domain-containing protein [Gracilimonas mengyeensis]|uniref:Uncharacterized protein n=1 Tax=Gracilimonas mengyeensis TaxID=1302730 RepID=A0A521AQS9_9BACT|nr:DUF952 domain-containing protein [Gracilimonas mengyeensis]SMO37010.1 Protein of unknown function [Gracilimonas mengyeensis]
MDFDLLFMAVTPSDWKKLSESGTISPGKLDDNSYLRAFQGKDAEEIINKHFEGEDSVMLLVLDPLRIQSPLKQTKEADYPIVAIQGDISIDTVIDKIRLKNNKEGKFSVHVKHFD